MSDRDDLVIVTGTSGGLGGATATALVGAGYRVVGLARRSVSADDLRVDPGSYTHMKFDLGEVDQIGELVATIARTIGKPYALVNNAALGTDGLLPTMHNSAIDTLVRVNITAPMVLTKYAVRHMLAARRGRVVNVSSIVARTGYRGLAAYGATKAAMEGFTRSLARDVGSRGVTVNAVAPGFLATEMTSVLEDGNLDRIRRRAALGRFAELDEVAAGIRYLLSDDAAGVTGTVLTIDGGSTA